MEHEFLSYDEAAVRLGIKPDSVRRRARSRKWPRRTGNDGRTLVGVPASALPPDNPRIIPRPSARRSGDAVRIAELEVEVRMLRDRLTDTQADRDRLAALLETALQPRPGLLERLARLVRG
jgi:hypothetical protein